MNMWRRALAEKRRIIVPPVIGIFGVVSIYVAVVFPLGRQITATEREERTSRDELVKARQDYNNAKATVTGEQQADSTLKKFYHEVLPADKSVAQRLTFTRLTELAKQSNVQLEHGTNDVSREKGSSLSKLTTRYTLTGDYRDVRHFIYALETAPEFMVLENIGLTSASDQQARSVAMNLEIATYFRSGDAAN
jgi:hypothetical protein